MSATTAILLFSYSPEREAARKGYGASSSNDVKIARALINRTRATLARTGLPVLNIDETGQRGSTFGERIVAAMSDAFALGYERLLVVGNDAPGLRIRHLRYGAQILEAGSNLIIPDQRGGIVLLGLSRQDFSPSAIAALPWESKNLSAAIADLLPAADVLPALHDINTLGELRAAWHLVGTYLPNLHSVLSKGFLPPMVENVIINRWEAPAPGRAPPVAS